LGLDLCRDVVVVRTCCAHAVIYLLGNGLDRTADSMICDAADVCVTASSFNQIERQFCCCCSFTLSLFLPVDVK
jgi:hypothetical protein